MSGLFAKALCGRVDWLGGTIRAALVSGAPNVAEDEFLSDLDALCSSAPLTGKTIKNGVYGAKGTVFTSIPNRQIDAVVIYQDEGKGRLIVLADEFRSGRLPRMPMGRSIEIVWGPDNAIFEL